MSRLPVRHTPHSGRAAAERERNNRTRWDQWSDRYQATTGAQLLALPAAWGAWRVPEAELRLLPDVAGKDVLELGCGAAQWSIWLAAHGATVTGIDLSSRQLAHARWNVARAGVTVRLVQGSAERLPFLDHTFDLALSDHGAMGWGHPDWTLPEAARVLRAGGTLIFCDTAPLFNMCWDDDLGAPQDRLVNDYVAVNSHASDDGSVSFTLSDGEWVRRFCQHGFVVEALEEPLAPPGTVSAFWPQATPWARRWPGVRIWKARQEGR